VVWWRNRIIGPGLKFEDSGCTDHIGHVMDINMREMLPVVCRLRQVATSLQLVGNLVFTGGN